MMGSLRAREEELYTALEGVPTSGVLVIGGYAVSARSIPRYSHDLDLVMDPRASKDVKAFLGSKKFNLERHRQKIEQNYGGSWERWKRGPKGATIDLLAASVQDRTFKVPFPYALLSEGSEILALRGLEGSSIRMPVATASVLIALKIQPLRHRDIGDIACLAFAGYDSRELRRLITMLARSKPTLLQTRVAALSSVLAVDLETVVRYLGPRIAGPTSRREAAAKAALGLCRELRAWAAADIA